MPTTPMNEFLDPPKHEGEIGRLGPYRVLEQIGKGGMGQVFRARDARLNRDVALKVMNEKFAATANSRQRFVAEARSMAAVHHDNVATVFEVSTHRGIPFIAMEMLQGEPLNQLLRTRQRFEPEEVIRMAREIASGLAAAHQRGIIHRDIKPGNLWIESPSGRAKLLDFGLAIAGDALRGLPPRGAAVGSPAYLSPEQARNDPVDERTDLYSLGVVMYQLCSGRLPLTKDSVIKQMIANTCELPPPLKQCSAETPQPLCDLIDRMLNKEPRNRPRNAAHLLELLDEVQQRCEAEKQLPVRIVTDARPRAEKSAESDEAKRSSSTPSTLETEPTRPATVPLLQRTHRGIPVWAYPAAAALLLVLSGIYVGQQRGVTTRPLQDDQIAPTAQDMAGQQGRAGQQNPTSRTSAASRSTQAAPFRVNPESLRPLVFGGVSGTQSVRSGEAARYDLELINQAEPGPTDPRRKNARAEIAAQVVTLLQPVGRTQTQTPAFPKKLIPAQLPRPNQTRKIDISFLTVGVLAGQYHVIFELQAPNGQSISRIDHPLEVLEEKKQEEGSANL